MVGTTTVALAAALALMSLSGCARRSRDDGRREAVPLAQFDSPDSGFGLPNPMPGSPIADGGITPITPIPSSTPNNPLPPNPTPGPIPSH
jgi:hypothetical protein